MPTLENVDRFMTNMIELNTATTAKLHSLADLNMQLGQKIDRTLNRAEVVATSHLESLLLVNPLQAHAGQHIGAGKVLGRNGHD